MREPRAVSVIVVNYNNERFLAPAIDSALGQSHPLSEVIVVDCSTTTREQSLRATDYRAPDLGSSALEAHSCSPAAQPIDRSLPVRRPGTGLAPNVASL